MAHLTLPGGEVVEFGPPGYSRFLVEFLALARRQAEAGEGSEVSDVDGLRMLELTWEIAVSSLVNAGRTREDAEAVMARIPLSKEFVLELRGLMGLE